MKTRFVSPRIQLGTCALVLMLLPTVGLADVPPMSFDAWREGNRFANRFLEKPVESVFVGIQDVAFYPGLVLMMALLFMCRPREGNRRLVISYWGSTVFSTTVVCAVHGLHEHARWTFAAIALVMIAFQAWFAISAWIRRRKDGRSTCLRQCGCSLLLMTALSYSFYECVNECVNPESAEEKERKAYRQYLQKHYQSRMNGCKKCGKAIYRSQTYCEECDPFSGLRSKNLGN